MPKSKVKVEDLYARDKNLKYEDVRIIQEWLKKQPFLPELQEYQILAFLHTAYYRIESAKTLIDNYFTLKTHHAKIFNHLDEDTFRHTLSYVFADVMPKKTSEDYAVLLVKILDMNADLNHNFRHFVSAVNMILTLYMHQNGFETGGCVVVDCKGFTFSHLSKLNLKVVKVMLSHLQEGAPLKIEGIHFINVLSGLETLKLIVKPLLSSKLYNMVCFHSDLDSLHQYIPQKCLPQEYDGLLPSINVMKEKMLENVLANYDFFRWHDSQQVDETKRIQKLKQTVFGPEGTFKKIELD